MAGGLCCFGAHVCGICRRAQTAGGWYRGDCSALAPNTASGDGPVQATPIRIDLSVPMLRSTLSGGVAWLPRTRLVSSSNLLLDRQAVYIDVAASVSNRNSLRCEAAGLRTGLGGEPPNAGYDDGEFFLSAGFCVVVVSKAEIIDGTLFRLGEVLLSPCPPIRPASTRAHSPGRRFIEVSG